MDRDKLLYGHPSQALLNPADCYVRNPELSCQRSLRATHKNGFSNYIYLLVSKGRVRMSLASMNWWVRLCAVLYRILHIFLLGSPPKIFYPIIKRVSVFVKAHKTARARPHKRLKHDMMKFFCDRLFVKAKADKLTLIARSIFLSPASHYPFIDIRSAAFSLANGFNPPKIRHHIAVNARNWFPDFHKRTSVENLNLPSVAVTCNDIGI